MDYVAVSGLRKIVDIADLAEYRCSGVYILFQEDEPVYVGQSQNVYSRIGQHMVDNCKVFDRIEVRRTEKHARLRIERQLIENLTPRYNVSGLEVIRKSSTGELKARKLTWSTRWRNRPKDATSLVVVK